MNRLTLLLLSITLGVLGFIILHKSTASRVAMASAAEEQYQKLSNEVAQLETQRDNLQAELQSRKRDLESLPPVIRGDPQILKLLNADPYLNGDHSSNRKKTVAALTKLRQEIGTGWNASSDYVLVNKRTLPEIDFSRLSSGSRPSSTASDILQLSEQDQANIAKAVKHVHDAAEAPALERKEPHDDVLAEYTAYPIDTAMEQTLSNRFSAEIATFLDPERLNLFVPSAWRDIRAQISPWRAETLTVTRVINSDLEPDVVWEVTREGQHIADGRVRYAQLPTQAFMKLLAAGWEAFAKQEGFDLPPRFRSQPY